MLKFKQSGSFRVAKKESAYFVIFEEGGKYVLDVISKGKNPYTAVCSTYKDAVKAAENYLLKTNNYNERNRGNF